MLKLGEDLKDELKKLNTERFKNVNGILIKSGQEHNDEDIKTAQAVIVYYTINNTAYVKSFYIPNTDMFGTNVGYSRWFMDSSDGVFIYVRAFWNDGKIGLSAGSTVVDEVSVLGYTIIKF